MISVSGVMLLVWSEARLLVWLGGVQLVLLEGCY